MRLPRVRFTVGALLLTVAVVAANCWAFQCLYKRCMYRVGGNPPLDYRILDIRIGVLPLANVALIGAFLVAARCLRYLRRGRTANPRSSLPGIAYFSLNFLVLGGLVCLCMPDVIPLTSVRLDDIREYAAGGWSAVFGQPEETIPWIIAQTAILGVCLSGPPLLLTWIGGSLAMRCASTIPRRRFRAMVCLVSLDFAGAALAICLLPRPFEDEQEVALDFRVVDESSGRPIAQAFLLITDPFSRDPDATPPRAFTDADGRARLTGRFVASGERNAFQIMGDFSPWGRWLEVSAEGRRTRFIPLIELLGAFADPARPGLHKVALVRGGAREEPFRDIAGIYPAGFDGFGGRCFEIESDGRFAWFESGCVPPDSQEYGYLKRHGAEIEPVLIPHPGREVDPLVTSRYRVTEWRDRLYLSLADERELREFCRAALIPDRPSTSKDMYGSYCRLSDRDKPQTGLPRLPPNIWVKFLTDEMSLNNAESSLRLAIDILISRILQPRVAEVLSSEPRNAGLETGVTEGVTPATLHR